MSQRTPKPSQLATHFHHQLLNNNSPNQQTQIRNAPKGAGKAPPHQMLQQVVPNTRFIEGSECEPGANGYPKSASPRKKPGSGSAPSPTRKWRLGPTTSQQCPLKAAPPSSTSRNSRTSFHGRQRARRVTSKRRPRKLPPWTTSTRRPHHRQPRPRR